MKRSIVMADWSLKNTPTAATRDEFLWQQILMAILYDEVLAQDQTLLLSHNLAKWFPDNESFRLLEEVFKCGSLTVLKHPIERYPQALQDRAVQYPISTRSEQLATYSNDNFGRKIGFSPTLIRFHNRLETLLADDGTLHRHAGAKSKNRDLMREFNGTLSVLLTDVRYSQWLSTEFPNIAESIRNEWAEFLVRPSKGIERLEAAQRRSGSAGPRLPNGSIFTKAFAAQLASTYGAEAGDLIRLIESTFAMEFIRDERSEGHYNRYLRAIPIAIKQGARCIDRASRVETVVSIPVGLPLLKPGFSDTIIKLKEKVSVRELRAAMNHVGHDQAFGRAEGAWRAVSQDLAALETGRETKKIDLRVSLVSTLTGLASGTFIDFWLNPLRPPMQLIAGQSASAISAFALLFGNIVGPAIQAGREEQELSRKLEDAVEFKCVQQPIVEEQQALSM